MVGRRIRATWSVGRRVVWFEDTARPARARRGSVMLLAGPTWTSDDAVAESSM